MFSARADVNTVKFVKAIENHPCLYNTTLKDYSKRETTDLAWSTIASEFNLTEQHCRDRWKNIRCCFVRAQKTGRRQYYLSSYLKFLCPFTKTKRSDFDDRGMRFEEEGESYSLDSNIENPEIIEYTEDPLEPDDNFQLSPTPQSTETNRETKESLKRKFQTSIKSKQDDSDSGRFEGSVSGACDDDDSDLLFFKSLLPDIRELPAKKKRGFKIKVMSLLGEFLEDE